MAKIIRKSNALYEKRNKIERKGKGWFRVGEIIIAISLLLYFAIGIRSLMLAFLAVIPLFVGFLTTIFYYRKQAILETGIEGEERFAKIIAQLPDTYFGFQNVEVTYEGKKSEMDMVVVGPTGIFIIEVKNLNGTIQGSEQSHQWIQHKIGRGGTPYSNEFHSPVKQVGTHVYRLANYLKRRGCRYYVNAMVFFTNTDVSLKLSGNFEKIPVYAITNGTKALYRHILDREEVLTSEQIKNVCKILKS